MKKRLVPNTLFFFFALAALLVIPLQASPASAGMPARPPQPAAVLADPGDWPMYGHDYQRTNFNPAETTINASNVNQLVQRWQANVGTNGTPTSASPSVSDGVVYVASSAASPASNLFAFNAVSGTSIWNENIGYRSSCFNVGIGSTPAISGTQIVIGQDNAQSNPAYNGISTIDGTKVWTNTMNVGTSGFPWESPFLYNGKAYLGIASRCDNPSVRGELRAVDMTSGNTVNSAFFVNAGGAGGGIWQSPALSPDGTTVAIGTGEDYSCSDCSLTRSMVTLDSNTLAVLQHHQEPSPNQDLDFGTSPVFFHDSSNRTLVGAGHKNGIFYVYDITTLNSGAVWSRSNGGVTIGLMPAYDPTFGSGGTLFDVNGSITALDPANGSVRWGPVTIPSAHGNIAIANGLIFVNGGSSGLQIRSETDGSLLRTITPPNAGATNSGVVVSHGFVYWLSGSYVNAWSLPAGGTPSPTGTTGPSTNTPTRTATPSPTTSFTVTPTSTGFYYTNTPVRSSTPSPTHGPACTPTVPPPTGTPGPCGETTVQLLNETFDENSLGVFTSTVVLTPTGGWTPVPTAVTCYTNYSAYAPDADSVSDQRLTLISPINIPSNAVYAQLQFTHSYGFDQSGGTYNDGGVLELSIDGGSSWFDAAPYFLIGGYTGNITRTGATCGGITPPFSNGQSAWVGTGGGSVRLDLTPFIGQSLTFRFRLGTDCSVGSTGWYVDNVLATYIYDQLPCTATPSPSPTHGPSPTATRPGTPPPSRTPLPTQTPGGPTATTEPSDTPTDTPIATPTSCTLTFTDVPPGSTFYQYVHCMACRGIINGYPDGTFRPNNDVTRGQLSKIVSNSAGYTDTQTIQIFQDVPPSGSGSTFFVYINRLASRGYISGYLCGGPNEPCVPPANLPYFRPNANATRGQISKIVSNAAGFNDVPVGQQFQDVAIGSTYYAFIYRLTVRGAMNGYPCGTAQGGPCVPPLNLPYFHPNNNATRGQTSKIVANTFFPDCNIPIR